MAGHPVPGQTGGPFGRGARTGAGSTALEIWVDADAVPTVIRDILCRAAERTGVRTVFVANRPVGVRRTANVDVLQVAGGFDVADSEIAERCASGDLVVTSDVPLAAEVVAKGALALSFRGERFTAENVRARLNMRDFMDTMRSSGVRTGGSAPLSKSDRMQFANELDRALAKARRG